MGDFFRFPHTPHLAWLGSGSARDDKVLSANEVKKLLTGDVLVEEKLDGANVGLSLTPNGEIRAQNRGHYLTNKDGGQFARLPSWIFEHSNLLNAVLTPNLILFGEWCAARHSLDYAELPDWFLLFDVYDRNAGRFWSSLRRNKLANKAGLTVVRQLLNEKTTMLDLKKLIVTKSSIYREGPMEGVVVRQESSDWCDFRAKLVRPDFSQSIDTHWKKRALEWNRISIPT